MGKLNIIKRIANIIFHNKLNLLKDKITPKKFKNYSSDLKINEYNLKNQYEKVEKILEKYSDNPAKLIEYIEGAKTPIYVVNNAEKILLKIKEEQGFIMPKDGLEALYLNLVLNRKIKFNTKEMFVMDKNFSSYLFAYEFYKWYCYKTGTKGYEKETQIKFKKVFNYSDSSSMEELSYDDIIELKTAIKRDIEAINFVKNYSKKHQQSSKVYEKLKEGKCANI